MVQYQAQVKNTGWGDGGVERGKSDRRVRVCGHGLLEQDVPLP